MKKKKNRDDFFQKTINALRRRAGNRCSNPDCRVPTDAPSDEGPEAVNNTGKAAHITAAAPGRGARRYNSALKPEERRSIHNGIWLCGNCATKIDNDDKIYTVALLHEWKKKTEESAKREQGKKLPDENDAINTLLAAATGQTSVFLPNLMPNASKAASSYLENLDPRFTVKTNFHEGWTDHLFCPKEDVKFKIIAKPEKIHELIRRGGFISFNSNEIKFEGLPSLKLSENSKIYLGSRRENILIKIKVVSPDFKSESSFYDLHGEKVSGTELMSIKADGLGGLFSVKISMSFDQKNEFAIAVNHNLWDRCELNRLKYFDQIYDLHHKIANKWALNFSVEREGELLFSACQAHLSGNSYFLSQFIYFDFIKMARWVSKKLRCPMHYNSLFQITEVMYSNMEIIYKILSEGSYKTPYDKSLCIKNTKFNNQLAEMISCSEEKFLYIKIDQAEREKIKLFDKELLIPKLSKTFTKIKVKLANSAREKASIGDLVDIELIPDDNSMCIIEKISDARSD
ncbi:MAG: hypothetical protein ACTFAK_15900 [Candidatus Electronema sp. VV]